MKERADTQVRPHFLIFRCLAGGEGGLECVAAGADFIDCGVFFGAKELDAFGLLNRTA